MGVDRDEFGSFTGTSNQIKMLATSMHIEDLNIDRPSVVAYLQAIAPDKQVIALVHALEVGVKELAARRERFKTA